MRWAVRSDIGDKHGSMPTEMLQSSCVVLWPKNDKELPPWGEACWLWKKYNKVVGGFVRGRGDKVDRNP